MAGRTTARSDRAAWIAVAALSWAGCVNNYVIDESDTGANLLTEDGEDDGDPEADGGDPSGDEDTTGTAGGASGEGTTTSVATGDMPTSGDVDGTGNGDPGDTGNDTGLAGVCDPCDGDRACGDGRGCVDLGGDAPVCLGPCTEMRPPCDGAATCEAVTTVDRTPRMLCVPTAMCTGE